MLKNDKKHVLIDNYNTQSEKKITEQKTLKKVDDPRCLLNTNESDIPRNKRCPVSNMKFKQCCGKLARNPNLLHSSLG